MFALGNARGGQGNDNKSIKFIFLIRLCDGNKYQKEYKIYWKNPKFKRSWLIE